MQVARIFRILSWGGYKDTADEYVVGTYGNDNEISEQADDTGGVYDFKDNKTMNTVDCIRMNDIF